MNTSVQGIIVNNCQYAPVYLIQDPGASQANTYVFTTNNIQQPKPICNNLKAFYENSGNIENGLVNVDTAVKTKIVKKKDTILIGNNLKLASFLLPKNDNINKQYAVENVEVKAQILTAPSNGAPTPAPLSIVPKIDMDRKIVKVKDIPVMNRTRTEKLLPKIKPKEYPPSTNQSKYTAVQLVNVGGTYHSLSHLNKEQVKIVSHALKMFKEPDKTAAEGNAGPAAPSNTRYLYKVAARAARERRAPRPAHAAPPPPPPPPPASAAPPSPPPQGRVTRSGRRVKLPRQMLPQQSPLRARKRPAPPAACYQCCAEFGSLYRLQKHYEQQPAHIPARAHADLWQCLLAAVRGAGGGGPELVRQLQRLLHRLRALLPCALAPRPGRAPPPPCLLAGDVARLFDMAPGKYHIDVDALNCVKDKDGFCIHNPPKPNQCNKDKLSPKGESNEDMINPESESAASDCARINSVAKWPTVSKRIWKRKTQETSAKKMRLKSEVDTLIDLGTEELTFKAEESGPTATAADEDDITKLLEVKQEGAGLGAGHGASPEGASSGSGHGASQEASWAEREVAVLEASQASWAERKAAGLETSQASWAERKADSLATDINKPNNNYVKFHSAHFDIRSSPIKSSSTVFRKFQINPSKMSNYQVQVIRSLDMVDKADDKQVTMSPRAAGSPQEHVADAGLHAALTSTDNSFHEALHSSDTTTAMLASAHHGLHECLPDSASSAGEVRQLSAGADRLDMGLSRAENTLHDIFKDDVDLTCKEDSNIDSDLKEWIINTTAKTEDSLKIFTKASDNLIEPKYFEVGGDGGRCADKCDRDAVGLPSLDDSDNRLLSNQGESVLNFLENLSNDLVYPETEIRNNSVDFQLDLFTFHNSV